MNHADAKIFREFYTAVITASYQKIEIRIFTFLFKKGKKWQKAGDVA